MRSLVIASMFLGFSTVGGVIAQDEIDTDEAVQERAEIAEEIIVEGRANLSQQVKKGFAAFREGRYEEAEKHFYRVRAGYQLRASQTFEAFSDLWTFSNVTGATNVLNTPQEMEARKALSIIHYMEGMSRRAQGDAMGARLSFKRAIGVNPTHFDARADLVLIELERGKPKLTEKHIKRLAKDFKKCDADKSADVCSAINDRLLQVEQAYGQAVSS